MWIVGRLEMDALVEGRVETEVEGLVEEGLVLALQQSEMPFITRVDCSRIGLWGVYVAGKNGCLPKRPREELS